MKIGITLKLFLAIVLTSLAAVLLMAITVRHSFHNDFLQYVNQAEIERLNEVAVELASIYEDRQSWDSFHNQKRAWRNFLRRFILRRGHGMMRHGHHNDVDEQDKELLPTGPYFANRLTLLDINKQYIVGRHMQIPGAASVPILSKDITIGWLSLNPASHLTNIADISFQNNQNRANWMISIVSILLAALVAVFLARHFRSPIKRLVDATRNLSAGDYSARIGETSGDELGQLQADFNRLAVTLEKNENTRRQWIADISHELRTPIAVLQGEIEALQDGIREVSSDSLGSLHSEVLYINNIIDDLYQLSMSDIGALDYKMENIEIVSVIEEVIAGYDKQLVKQSLDVSLNTEQCTTIQLFADVKRLHQLFGNLLQNTLRYTNAGGKLEIWCETVSDILTLHWRDSSPGVRNESLPHLFERLYRTEESRSRQLGGSGLGLAICKNIVEAHEGVISAQHSPIGGLWITITFPLKDSKA